MELETKSSTVTGDVYIAHTDGSGSLAKEEQPAINIFEDSRIKSLRLINALSYALTTLIVLSSILTSSNNEYDNYMVWKTNQTLLSVAPYTQYIWYLLLILQGLFIAASFLPSLRSSELLGYSALAAETGEVANKTSLPVVHYPALCASTLLTMYSVKLNIMGLAFVGSCASTFFLVNIIKYQLDNTITADITRHQSDNATTLNEFTFSEIKSIILQWYQRRRAPALLELDGTSPETSDVTSNQIQQYFFLKFPFELYAGYNLALNVAFLNIVMHKIIVSAVFNLVLVSVSLVLLLGVGCYATWTDKKGLCIGIGGGLAWYLFGVFFQLLDPSTPIMMMYSEEAIAATKYMAVIFANIILSTVALRAVKNAINVRIVCGGDGSDEMADEQEDEDDVITGYAKV